MADVTVMGAGIFGLSVGWACARRGARVRVIDPKGVGMGASGGVVGALAPHVPERWNEKKQFQFESLIMAEAFWKDVESASGLSSGYGRTGRLQPIPDERMLNLARERAEQAREHWRGAAVWELREAAEFGEWVPPSPTGMVIRDTLSARVDPRRALASLVGALRKKDAVIAKHGRPEGQVVWATGHEGLQALSQSLGRAIGTGVKGQAAVLGFDAGGKAPQVFVDGIHFIAHDDGTVAVGSTSETDFDDPGAPDHLLEDLLERAFRAMPVVAGADVTERWAGIRPRAATRAPLLGRWPGREGHYIANGGFKIGFGMAPRAAEAIADLILDGRDTIPQEFTLEYLLER